MHITAITYLYSASNDTTSINWDLGQKWQLRNMRNGEFNFNTAMITFWSGLLRAPKRSLACQYFCLVKQFGGEKVFQYWAENKVFLLCEKKSFFPTGSVLKFTLPLCNCAPMLLLQLKMILLFFLCFLVSAWIFMQPAPQLRWQIPRLNLT